MNSHMHTIIVRIFRKSSPLFHSIERVFSQWKSVPQSGVHISDLQLKYGRIHPLTIISNVIKVYSFKADVYHITGDVHYLQLFLNRHRTLLTIHDCVFLHQSSGLKRWILKKIFLDWPVSRAKYITTISEKTKKEIIDYTGCDSSKIVVIPNPVDRHIFYSERLELSTVPKILFIGSTAHKNLENCLDALRGISCQLLLVGTYNFKQLELIQNSGIDYVIRQNLTDKAMGDMYADCDIVLFPSLYEGFGLPVIEGQRSGRAVITSNISPLNEIAGNGACFVDPLDIQSIRSGVLKVITDDHYRMEIIQNGLINARKYSSENIASSYGEIYIQILNGNSSSS